VTESGRSVDPAALDRLLVMTGGDPEFLDELIQTFVEDAVVQLDAMRSAAETGANADLVRPAHSLKSNSANMGAERLSDLCRGLEADARAGAVDRAIDRVAETANEFERVRAEITALQAAR
jgi:two-component system, sensor histidine kinase and response regulator